MVGKRGENTDTLNGLEEYDASADADNVVDDVLPETVSEKKKVLKSAGKSVKPSSGEKVKKQPVASAEALVSEVSHEDAEEEITEWLKLKDAPASAKESEVKPVQKKRVEHHEPHTPVFHEHKLKEDSYDWRAVLGIIVVVAIVAGFFLWPRDASPATSVNAPIVSAAKAAHVDLTFIMPSCNSCADITALTGNLQSLGFEVNASLVPAESDAGKSLIVQYSIKKLPAAVARGEISKLNVSLFASKGDAKVVETPLAPFVDVASGKVQGVTNADIVLADFCKNCSNASSLVDQLKNLGVVFNATNVYLQQSVKGQELIKKYELTRLPTVILSSDANYYSIITDAWPRVGSVESDGVFVLRQLAPPFWDLALRKKQGVVKLTLLNDSSCVDCVDVNIFQQLIEGGFGVVFGEVSVVDVNDAAGQLIVKKYNITKVPTVLLSSDAEWYLSLNTSWSEVGTRENGVFVFRNVDLLTGAKYRNVQSGEIVG